MTKRFVGGQRVRDIELNKICTVIGYVDDGECSSVYVKYEEKEDLPNEEVLWEATQDNLEEL